MEMGILFLKIFFLCFCVFILWFLFRKILVFIRPFLDRFRTSSILNKFFYDDIYDRQIIKKSMEYYLPAKCLEIDPFQTEIKYSKRSRRRNDLTKKLDTFLDHGHKRNILILGASGMGKTSFALNYFLHNKRRIRKQRHKLVLVPLRIKDADDLILTPSNKKNRVLFLEGFDEDVKAIQNPRKRLKELIRISQKYKRIVITCSTNFFPKDTSMQRKSGYERIGPGNVEDDHFLEFRRLYISPFTQSEMEKYIRTSFYFWEYKTKKKCMDFIKNNSTIRLHPLQLSFLKELFENEAFFESLSTMYNKIIENWLNREHSWEDKALLYQFSRKLAVDLFLNSKSRGEEAVPYQQAVEKAEQWGIPFYPLESNKKSLILQSPHGKIQFAHRSVMEYLFVQKLIGGDKSCYQKKLTEQMAVFLLEMLENNSPENLRVEFNWLSQFRLIAHGLKLKESGNGTGPKKNLFKTILNKNPQFKFLDSLKSLIKNPIFYEFGWDPKLNKNLRHAVYELKPSLMKKNDKEMTVKIDSSEIELKRKGQNTKRILFNDKEFNEYNNLMNNLPIISLNKAIGLKGLILYNNINQSKNFCVLPDLKTFKQFTLYFWSKQFN